MIQPEETAGKKIWLLSRALVTHKYIVFPEEVKGSKRFKLVTLQARTHSPYAQMRSYMHWTQKGVSVWMWDHKAVQRKIKRAELNEREFTFVPETVFVSPLENGTRLVECHEGVDGQIWKDGQIIASRWWPESPPASEWAIFLRGAGPEAQVFDQALPQLTPLENVKTESWAHTRPIAGGFSLETLYSNDALAVLALILLLPMGYYMGQIFHAWSSISGMQREIEAMGTDTEKVELEKKAAENNLKKVNTIIALNPYLHPLTVLKKVIGSLAEKSVVLSEFKVTGDLVTLLLQGDEELDATAIVTMLDKVPEFENVNTDPGRALNTLKVTFKVKKSGEGKSK